MLNLPFTDNMNEPLLKIDKDGIIKSDYRSNLKICQIGCLKKYWKIKKMDAFKYVEGTQYKSQKFN